MKFIPIDNYDEAGIRMLSEEFFHLIAMDSWKIVGCAQEESIGEMRDYLMKSGLNVRVEKTGYYSNGKHAPLLRTVLARPGRFHRAY
ncbi:MAG: hypothetical protein Q8N99_07405 [Nanoarchaeota archaeon]|nr:hypothetical protein [Nanoarchaeota archaeon]